MGVVGLTAGAAFGSLNIDVRITTGADDFEEGVPGGAMDNGSSDLEIPYESAGTPVGTTEQVIGLRFTPVPISKGTEIKKAYVELEMDETKGNTQVVNVIIEGQLIANAPAFTTTAKDITNRTRTKAQVKWTIPTGMANDTEFQSPDISSIINEIIGQAGWVSGNAIVIIIGDDKSNPSAGVRCVEAVEGESLAAPLLRIEVVWPLAVNPSPANGDTGVTQPLFSWTGGDGAIFHNVYFGTTPDLTAANLVAPNQPFAMYYHVPGIEPDVKYYWRVDEIDAAGKVSAGAVWSFSAAATKAYSPFPLNGGKYAPTDVKLTWTAGYGAVFHTVYFGTSFDDVNKASGGTGQAATTYTPAGPLTKGTTYYWRVDEVGAPPASTVAKGSVWSFTTMGDITITDPALVGWWAFDEGSGSKALDFSGHGNDGTLGGGVKWAPGILGSALQLTSGYVAIDGVVKGLTGTNLTLSAWIKTTQGSEGNLFAANDSASAHPLMFGISGGNPYAYDNGAGTQYPAPTGAVNDNQWHMLTFVRNGGTAYIYLDGTQIRTYASTFSLSTVTRWSIGQEWDGSTPSDFYNGLVDDVRIYNKALTPDEVKELMRGDPLVAWKPSPGNGSTVDVVKAEQGLAWTAGDNAKQHDVYFGTDKAAVEGANAADKTGVYRGRQAQAGYTPTEALGWGTGPYYWRIDEVQATGTVSAGAVWSFSVASYLVVDDFESYNDIDEDKPGSNRIYLTWIDGYQTTTNGAQVGNLSPPLAETRPAYVHGGNQAMPVLYDNNRKSSQATLTLTGAARNWTREGVTDLSLWFRGDAANAAEQMYVSLSGKAPVYNTTANAVQAASYAEWRIPLSTFTAQGVNLASVTSIVIGFGTPGNTTVVGGTGTAYIDDIRLTKPAPAVTGPIDIPLAVAGDDVEEQTASGTMSQNSDLEMPFESAGTTIGTVPQVIGLRYTVPIAKGTKITKAYVEFTVDEIKGGTQVVNLVIDGQLSPNAPPLATTAKDLTGRTRTTAKVSWAVPNWTTVGAKSQTPDLSAILNEIFSQTGWASGNAIVLIFADDASKPSAGVRCADTFEDQASNAGTGAVLHIE
jgi:hypothetical protein